MKILPGAQHLPSEDPPELHLRGHRFILSNFHVFGNPNGAAIVMKTGPASDVGIGQFIGCPVLSCPDPMVVLVITGVSAQMIMRVLTEEAEKRVPPLKPEGT